MTFFAKSISLEELNSLESRLKNTLKRRLRKRQFCGKFVESPRKVCAQVATANNFKNAKLADLCAVEQNWQ